MLTTFIDYLKNILGVERPIVVTILLTMSTFTLGFVINWLALAVMRWLKKKRFRASLMAIIYHFVWSCKEQAKISNEFKNQKGFLHGDGFTFQIKSNFAISYLSKLDVATFIENFSKNFDRNRPSEICKIFSNVEAVRFQNEKLISRIEQSEKKYWEYSDDYREGIEGIRQLRDEILSEYQDKTPSKEIVVIVTPLMKIFEEWIKNGSNKNPFDTYSQIVKPFYEYISENKPSPLAAKFLNFCLKCINAYENIEKVVQVMKEDVEYHAEVNQKAHDEILIIYNKWK